MEKDEKIIDVSAEEIKTLIEEYEVHAEKHGFILNPNKKIVEHIVRAILKKEKECGHGYCPCRVVTGNIKEDQKIVCPCVYHLDELKDQGYCHCRLFVKK